MSSAMKAVLEEGINIRKAAERHGVTKSTESVVGCYLVVGVDRRSCLLIMRNVNWKPLYIIVVLLAMEKPKVISKLLSADFWNTGGSTKTVSNGWWWSFIKHHPKIVLRQPSALGKARYLATNKDILDNYFDLLETTMTTFKLSNKPCLMQCVMCGQHISWEVRVRCAMCV